MRKISKKTYIDTSLEKEFYIEDLKTMIYFEKKSDNVQVYITFKYGDIDINPFNNKENKAQEGEVLIRDIEKEMDIINQLLEFGFLKTNEGFEIQDETLLLEFLISGLEKLKQVAEIYYS